MLKNAPTFTLLSQNIALLPPFLRRMLRRLLRRVYLDRDGERVWLDGSWHPVYKSGDGYVCRDLSVKQLSSLTTEDIPDALLLEVTVTLNPIYMGAKIYVERGRVNVNVYVDWLGWPHAVGREESRQSLTSVLNNLGYDVKLYERSVKATITCSGKLSPYLEDLVKSLKDFLSWVSELHGSRVQEARRKLDRLSQVNGRSLAALKGVTGVTRMLVASLTNDDIAYLLLGSGEVNSHVKSVIFSEMRLNERDVYERLRVLGLYRRTGEVLQPLWPLPLVRRLTEDLYSSWRSGGPAVSQYLNAYYLMAYIRRNLYSLIVKESRHGRDVRWRYGLRKFLEERLYPKLTFIDVAVTASLCLGIQVPHYRLNERLKKLIDLGIISENLKPRPYAIHITRLVKGYMVKTKLVKKPRERIEWENILGWRTLTNLDHSRDT